MLGTGHSSKGYGVEALGSNPSSNITTCSLTYHFPSLCSLLSCGGQDYYWHLPPAWKVLSIMPDTEQALSMYVAIVMATTVER